jgi:hypothetical protein
VKAPAFNYYKAVAGFLAAALSGYLGAQDGGVTGQEWLNILLLGLGGSGLVLISPKNTPTGKHADKGEADAGLLLLVLTFVGVVLLLFRVHF